MLRTYGFATLLAMFGGGLVTAAAERVIPDEFPQKGEEWAEPSPKTVSRGPVGAYPVFAELMGLTGSTTVIFWINPKGDVTRPLIHSSEPAGIFEASCLDYIRTFKYAPQVRADSTTPRTRRWSYKCNFKLE